MKTAATQSPVSWRLKVRHLPEKGVVVTQAADAGQKEALALAHDLVSVGSYAIRLTVTPWKRAGVKISGMVEADIVQRCVVTLDPVPARIREAVEAILVPEGSILHRPDNTESEILLEAEGDDLPESFSGDSVDLGALAEEFFVLGIDPYPRKPGAEITAMEGVREENRHNPFRESLQKSTTDDD